jgi:hypothetical protein
MMTITNKGPFAASHVQIIDSLPQNSVVSATPSQGSCAAVANFQIVCSLGSLASGSGATLNVVMAAGTAGPFTNSVAIGSDSPDADSTNNAASTTVTVNAAPDFSLSPSSTTLLAHPGSSVTDVLAFATLNGFAGTIALTCSVSGPAPLPACDLSPNSIASNANPPTSTLTVRVPAGTNVLFIPRGDWRVPPVHGLPFLCVLVALALAIKHSPSRRRALPLGGGLVAIALVALVLCGCGSNSTRQPKLYTITVTATANTSSGPISHTTTVGLTVQ